MRQKLFEAEFQSESRLSARQELPALIPVGLYVSPSLSQFNNLSLSNFFRTDIVETRTTGFFFSRRMFLSLTANEPILTPESVGLQPVQINK